MYENKKSRKPIEYFQNSRWLCTIPIYVLIKITKGLNYLISDDHNCFAISICTPHLYLLLSLKFKVQVSFLPELRLLLCKHKKLHLNKFTYFMKTYIDDHQIKCWHKLWPLASVRYDTIDTCFPPKNPISPRLQKKGIAIPEIFAIFSAIMCIATQKAVHVSKDQAIPQGNSLSYQH